MNGRDRRQCIVVLFGEGHAARSFMLPRWSASAVAGALTLAILASAGAGFQLQARFGIALPSAQQLHHGRAARKHRFAAFERLVPSLEGEGQVTLRRRGAIVHALKLGLGNRRAASQLLAGVVSPEWRQAAERGPKGDGTLLWPVEQGWYVRGYGSGLQGYHLAVDIMGERGSDVRAAAPGLVGYAGNALRGFGNLVMLIHPGGWVTVYAHNDAHYVVAGERVSRGQAIAALGNTGISRGPHVHFELIHGGRNCDPVPLFRPGVRHRGHLADLPKALWRPGSARPDEVRCAPRRKHPHSRWVDADAMEPQAKTPSEPHAPATEPEPESASSPHNRAGGAIGLDQNALIVPPIDRALAGR